MYIFRENWGLKKTTFARMNEVESLYHSTPQGYYKCVREAEYESLDLVG